MDEAHLIGAFALGLLGSLHCVGMCGGISMALGQGVRPHGALPVWVARVNFQMLFGMGRISSYMLAGFLVASLGETARLLLGGLTGVWLRSLAGVLIALMGLHIAGVWSAVARLEALGRPLWIRLQPLTRQLLPVNTSPRALALGALWGFLPCGLVYSTLALSLTTAAPWQGALTMGYFGLGTLPAMAGIGLLSSGVSGVLQSHRFRRLAGLMLVVLGGWTVVQAWAHAGHGSHGEHPGAARHGDHRHHGSHDNPAIHGIHAILPGPAAVPDNTGP